MATNEGEAAPPPRPRRSSAAARPQSPLAAFVLHAYDWSESSLIVELFTRERGRIVVVAKGAKRPTSNFRPLLLPFQPLQALLGRAPSDEQAEVHTLRGAEWTGGQPLMPPASLLGGYYLNELLLKLLARQDPHPALFDAYADTVVALAAGEDEGAALRAFELLLLRELGVLTDLSRETLSDQPLQAQARYTLQPEAGLVPSSQGLAANHWVKLEAALSHGSARALRHACTGLAGALRVPLREVLHYHLGHSTLRTRQVWQGVRKLAASARVHPSSPS